jgi:hypothetical protein
MIVVVAEVVVVAADNEQDIAEALLIPAKEHDL